MLSMNNFPKFNFYPKIAGIFYGKRIVSLPLLYDFTAYFWYGVMVFFGESNSEYLVRNPVQAALR